MAVNRHLVFRVVRTQDRHLVLGKSESLEDTRELTIAGTFDPLALSILADYQPPVVEYDLTVEYTFPDLVLAIDVNYEFDVPNYLVHTVGMPWQQAECVNDQKFELPWQAAQRLDTTFSLPWHTGQPIESRVELPWHQAGKVNGPGVDLPWHQAGKVNGPGVDLPWHSAKPVNPPAIDFPWRQGLPRGRATIFPWQDGKPTHRAVVLPWQQAKRHHRVTHLPWRDGGRMVSYGGPPIVPEPPIEPVDPCFDQNRHLVLAEPHGDRHLIFICELHPTVPGETIVVPIRRVYSVINETLLIRVSDSLPIPTYGCSVSLDWQSWTWSFSARLPATEYDNVKPDTDGTPVELQLTINGYSIRVTAESLSTDRQFGSKYLSISGRGKNAILDAPYAPFLTFDNASGARTANQLMDEALMLNGVPIGWDVDFGLDDWLIGPGAWVHQGTHLSAVMAIAQAAGGYVQPHPTADTLLILPCYELLPRDWAADLTPTFELPADVVKQEGMAWAEKPRYDRVFISGTSQGVLGQITITGEDGDLPAPTVTDPLITESGAAVQRGRSVLGDTGRVNMVTLRLPVLELTGVIVPGQSVRYVDGVVEKLGIVRGVSVEVGHPEVWQVLQVETHE